MLRSTSSSARASCMGTSPFDSATFLTATFLMLFAAALLFLILTYIYPDVSYGNCIMELE